jgi:hypothetical protein
MPNRVRTSTRREGCQSSRQPGTCERAPLPRHIHRADGARIGACAARHGLTAAASRLLGGRPGYHHHDVPDSRASGGTRWARMPAGTRFAIRRSGFDGRAEGCYSAQGGERPHGAPCSARGRMPRWTRSREGNCSDEVARCGRGEGPQGAARRVGTGSRILRGREREDHPVAAVGVAPAVVHHAPPIPPWVPSSCPRSTGRRAAVRRVVSTPPALIMPPPRWVAYVVEMRRRGRRGSCGVRSEDHAQTWRLAHRRDRPCGDRRTAPFGAHRERSGTRWRADRRRRPHRGDTDRTPLRVRGRPPMSAPSCYRPAVPPTAAVNSTLPSIVINPHAPQGQSRIPRVQHHPRIVLRGGPPDAATAS